MKASAGSLPEDEKVKIARKVEAPSVSDAGTTASSASPRGYIFVNPT